jgi:tetratricopeptide (TPR) repeat protein
MGSLLQARGDLQPARLRFEQALRLNEKALGPSHAQVAESLTRLGGVYVQSGDTARALPMLQRAVWIATFAGAAPHVWRAQLALHQAYTRDGAVDLAIFWGKRSVNTLQAVRGELAGSAWT